MSPPPRNHHPPLPIKNDRSLSWGCGMTSEPDLTQLTNLFQTSWTPLHLSSYYGHLETVRFLLECNVQSVEVKAEVFELYTVKVYMSTVHHLPLMLFWSIIFTIRLFEAGQAGITSPCSPVLIQLHVCFVTSVSFLLVVIIVVVVVVVD